MEPNNTQISKHMTEANLSYRMESKMEYRKRYEQTMVNLNACAALQLGQKANSISRLSSRLP